VIFHAILERAPAIGVRLNPEIPPKLEGLIQRALEKDRTCDTSTRGYAPELLRLKRDTDSGKTNAVRVDESESSAVGGTTGSSAAVGWRYKKITWVVGCRGGGAPLELSG